MKKEFKGTKGKWDAKSNEMQDSYDIAGTRLGGKYKIARCKYLGDYDKEETIMNAKLISAAPELLEALQTLMEGVAGLPQLSAINGVLKEQFELAEKAVNKALGL